MHHTKVSIYTQDEIDTFKGIIKKHMVKFLGDANFTSLSSRDIEEMFNQYDDIVFNGQIKKKLREISIDPKANVPRSSTLAFEITKGQSSKGFAGICKKQVINKNIHIVCEYTLGFPPALYTKLFINTQDKKSSVKSGGIDCYTRLDCLMLTFEHELIHLLMNLWDYGDERQSKKLGVHGDLFKCMLYSYFRQTEIHHLLDEELASTISKGLSKDQVKVGMKVKFPGADKNIHRGIVTKLNPSKAKVATTDRRTWNVAYHFLSEDTERSEASDPEDNEVPKKVVPPYVRGGIDKSNVKVGMAVKFIDAAGNTYKGIVSKINPTKAIVVDTLGRSWNVDYKLLLEEKDPVIVPKVKGKNDFHIGQKVMIVAKGISTDVTYRVVIIEKLNPTHAIVKTSDGLKWKVGYPAFV